MNTTTASLTRQSQTSKANAMGDDLISRAQSMLNPCRACPRLCLVDRPGGEKGFCRIGALAKVASAGAHFGEEKVLVGQGGSGTIFFQGCNLNCAYCQNCNISQGQGGKEMTAKELAKLMLELQASGCVNINFVTPSHVAPQVLEAIIVARGSGMTLPTVYNSGGYDSVEMLELLEGYIDIYMPDFKYGSSQAGQRYSRAEDYPGIARAALAEMHRQAGPLELDERGVAVRGLLVRHLVLPMDLGEAEMVIDIVAEVAPGAGMNIMDQYRPCFQAADFPELLVLPTAAQVKKLREHARQSGLNVVTA